MIAWLSLAQAGVLWTTFDAKLKTLVAPALEAGRLDGVTVAAFSGDDLHVITLGARASERTVYPIGSVSKAFTGDLLAISVAQGEVALDDSLSKHLPGAPKWAKKISLRQLATHTSGLPRLPPGLGGEPLDPYKDWDADKLLASLAQIEPEPAGVYAYSNLGAALVGRALENATGTPYTQLLERVTGPLGLKDTGVGRPVAIQGHTASGTVVPTWNLNSFAAAGGVRSHAIDMGRWLMAHKSPPKELAALKVAMQVHHRDHETDVGLFWHRTPDGIVWHNGQTGGYHSLVALAPGLGIGVVVLGSTATPLVDDIGFGALALVQGSAAVPLNVPTTLKLLEPQRQARVGTYGPAVISDRDDKLWLELSGQPPYRMWAKGHTVFTLLEAPVTLTFEGESLQFEQQGAPTQTWTRTPSD